MKKSLLFFALVLASYGTIQAQVTTSSMTGVVTQSSGSSTSGATIKAVHTPSGTTYSGSANESGRFNLANMRVGGPYRIEVTYVGQDPIVYEDVYLQLGQPFVLNPVFGSATGTAIEEVTIVGSRSLTNKNSGISTNISRKKIEEMPAISRSITDLTKLTPQANSQGDGFSFAGRNSLFNSLTLDGAQMNNAFGLSSLPGGGTGAQPFSLDAIEAIQINLSPYDVNQGGFTGAGVNAITKSGSNKVTGSVYTYYKNQDLQGYQVGDIDIAKTETYSNKQIGASLGGPIIKDKLFFFINGEHTTRVTPGTNMLANRGVQAGGNISNVLASDLDRVKDLLISKYGYDPGAYEGYNNDQKATNLTARFDWNIDERNKVTVRYNFLKSFRDVNPSSSNSRGRGSSLTSMNFSGLRYRQNENINSITAELNSSFNSKWSNNLKMTYSGFRAKRDMLGGAFPLVDIENGAGANYMSFGSEPFSGLNVLNQDLYSLSNDLNLYAGNHKFTFGASVGYQKYDNAFAQMFNGQFRYNTVDDFINAANGSTTVTPLLYQLTYSAVSGKPRPSAQFSMMPISVYAQDDWFAMPNLKFSYGIRLDMPIYTADITANEKVNAMTFKDEHGLDEKLDVSRLPKSRVQVSPRIAVDYDVYGNKSLVLRAGSGLFTGGVPGVWLTNQAGQTGLLFGSDYLTNPTNRPFTNDPAAYIPSNPTTPSSYEINATANNFRLPQIWRSSFGVDYTFPWKTKISVEGMFTKSLTEVYHRDANQVAATGQYSGLGDTRYYYAGTSGTANRINSSITRAIVLDNTSKGHAANITVQLSQTFGKYGDVMVAYTKSDARDVTSNPGSQANSAYTGNPVVDQPNKPRLSYTNFLVSDRVVAAVNINFAIAKNFPSKVGLFYEGRPYGDQYGATRFSFLTTNDPMSIASRISNQLMFVPGSREQIELVDIQENSKNRTVFESANDQWNRLNAFINQDDYLSTRKGKYAERNGAQYPWMNRFDLRFMQEISALLKNNGHKLQLSVDIINLGNLLNSEWGTTKIPVTNNVLQFVNKDSQNRPVYQVNQALGTETYRVNTGMDSRYQIQLGVRYIFN